MEQRLSMPRFLNALFDLSEFFAGGAEGFLALGEVEADIAVLRFAEKARSGHSGDADGFDQVLGRFSVGGKAERRDVEQRVVGSLRSCEVEAGALELAE